MSTVRRDSATTQKEKEMRLHVDGAGSVTSLSLSPLKNTAVSTKIKKKFIKPNS